MPVSLRDSFLTVWRVENENGEGPFQHPAMQKMLSERGLMPIGDPSKPAAEEDSLIRDIFKIYSDEGAHIDWLFGVTDLQHYNLWFGDEDIQEILACSGFALKEYKVAPDYVHLGTNQCLFWRPAALQYADP